MSDEATLAANKLIGRRVLVELWGEGKREVADELYAPDYVSTMSALGPKRRAWWGLRASSRRSRCSARPSRI
jgi:hypothetical protein